MLTEGLQQRKRELETKEKEAIAQILKGTVYVNPRDQPQVYEEAGVTYPDFHMETVTFSVVSKTVKNHLTTSIFMKSESMEDRDNGRDKYTQRADALGILGCYAQAMPTSMNQNVTHEEYVQEINSEYFAPKLGGVPVAFISSGTQSPKLNPASQQMS